MYVMQKASLAKLKQVHPLLAEEIKILASEFYTASGNELIVTEGLRTWDRQLELYNQGRTTPGDIVTNAPPGHSWHQFGLAVDVVPEIGTQVDWNPEHPVWKQLIELSDVHTKLVHVNINRTQRDWPHFQMTGSLPISPDEVVRDSYTLNMKAGVTLESAVLNIWSKAFPDYVIENEDVWFS